LAYDNTCKFLAERYPVDFARWLLSVETTDIQVLKTELNQEPIRADSLTFLQILSSILHLEFQTLPVSTPPLPFRMLDYSVRLKRQYNCDVEQVVIFLKPTNSEIAFTEIYQDRTTTHRYRVIRLWEQDPAIFLGNPGLLPFASLTRSDAPEMLLSQVAEQVARIESSSERENISACAYILAGLRFEDGLIQQLLRSDLMRESVTYQAILEEGRVEGRREALQQGLQQGKQEEAASLIQRLLVRRVGAVDEQLQQQIQSLSLPKLEDLGEALLDFSQPSDLIAWLQENS